MSGTYQKHFCDLLNTFGGSESLWKALFCIFWQTFAVFDSKSTIFGFKIAPEAMQIKIPGAVLSVQIQKSAFQRLFKPLKVFKRSQTCFWYVSDILEKFEENVFSSHFDPQN